jgi:hypothetical protein
MSSDADAIKRSITNVQAIYAVVIALAISQAAQSLLKDPTAGSVLDFQQIRPGLPAFVSFLFTLVPFWHGMNRHLDRSYIEKKNDVAHGALLLDLFVFFVEAGCLFLCAWSLRSGIDSFKYLGFLLVIDSVWGYISHQIHYRGQKSNALRWAGINFIAVTLAVIVAAYRFDSKPEVLMIVAICRSIVDYWWCYNFYFPYKEDDRATQEQAHMITSAAR